MFMTGLMGRQRMLPVVIGGGRGKVLGDKALGRWLNQVHLTQMGNKCKDIYETQRILSKYVKIGILRTIR
jgi:hypothetical protein